MVSSLCILVNIVLKPVAIVSALSRVVCLTLVNTAKNSFNAFVPSLTPLLALANTPPVRCIAEIKSLDSTAKAAATALTEPNACSSCPAPILNCLIKAILPSTVSFKLSKDGAKSVNARACKAFCVSLALKPACANVDDTLINSSDETPSPTDNLEISLSRPESCAAVLSVTCCNFTNSFS